jgi:anaerobic ribonucleoside-triphosphate reductase
MAVNCERCGKELKDQTYRFCRKCQWKVLGELARCGYLQNTYVPPYFSDARGRKGTRNPWPLAGAYGR